MKVQRWRGLAPLASDEVDDDGADEDADDEERDKAAEVEDVMAALNMLQ